MWSWRSHCHRFKYAISLCKWKCIHVFESTALERQWNSCLRLRGCQHCGKHQSEDWTMHEPCFLGSSTSGLVLRLLFIDIYLRFSNWQRNDRTSNQYRLYFGQYVYSADPWYRMVRWCQWMCHSVQWFVLMGYLPRWSIQSIGLQQFANCVSEWLFLALWLVSQCQSAQCPVQRSSLSYYSNSEYRMYSSITTERQSFHRTIWIIHVLRDIRSCCFWCTLFQRLLSDQIDLTEKSSIFISALEYYFVSKRHDHLREHLRNI